MLDPVRTDLALEAPALNRPTGTLPGVRVESFRRGTCTITRVRVEEGPGARSLKRQPGLYGTVEFSPPEDQASFLRCAGEVARELSALLPEDPQAPMLVLGLGNRATAPDAIGPLTVDQTVVTWPSEDAPSPAGIRGLRPVAVLSPGVAAATGLECADILLGVVERCRPAVIVAVDALATTSRDRLCAAVQLTDAGISPGAGMGLRRRAINQALTGVPVIAIGVPTVMDVPGAPKQGENLLITRRDIELQVRRMGRLLGWAISAAAHPALEPEDFPLFLS